jgi:hypothetical protein
MFESGVHGITVRYQQHSRVNATGVSSAINRVSSTEIGHLSHVVEVEALPCDPSSESLALVFSCRHMAASCTTTRTLG